MKTLPKPKTASAPRQAAPGTGLRSGAVARMVGMPVATLRVWESRYGVTRPQTSPSGQRLYSPDDVRRLVLLKQLTERGHAIGSLARLDMQQLQQIATTHASVLSVGADEAMAQDTPPAGRHWRVAAIGAAAALRLGHPEVLQRLTRPVQVLGPFPDVAEAARALQGVPLDALVVHEPRLHDGWLADLESSAPTLAALPKAVLYRFAAASTCATLADAGVHLLREPQNDTVLGQWLQGLLRQTASLPRPPARDALHTSPPPARRWDDAVLTRFAHQSSTMACECPRHVAELLMQLAHFEAYSAECRNRSPADAELHAYLQRTAAQSRTRFEAALEQVALHEGLLLQA